VGVGPEVQDVLSASDSSEIMLVLVHSVVSSSVTTFEIDRLVGVGPEVQVVLSATETIEIMLVLVLDAVSSVLTTSIAD